MLEIQQHALIARYRNAAEELDRHITISERLVDQFGLAYMKAHLVNDLAKELQLGDAFEDLQAELTAELLEVDVIPFGDGYYKVDANGFPKFFANVLAEVVV